MLPKEVEISYPELSHLAECMMNTFIQRRDLFAKQLDDGRYICIRKPLTPNHILAHLRGDITLGAYILDQSSRTRYVVFDADDDAQLKSLVEMTGHLAEENIPTYLEASRRGGHLWIFLPKPYPGKAAREFGSGLAKRYGLSEIELFPKQDRLKDGPGSLIRLPFGIHRRTGQRYGFLSPEIKPLSPSLAVQISILSRPGQVSESVIASFRSRKPEALQIEPSFAHNPAEGTTLSNRIKNSISAYEFIGKYVQLTENGQGLCPFHEDRVNSFAVHPVENYWNCFAGCGGGSIIDFWMKWQNCDFTTAVRELGKLLL